MKLEKNILTIAACALSAVLLASCASTSSPSANQPTMGEAGGISDPMEEQNRRVFALNQAIDGAFINPIVHGYQLILPDPLEVGVDNALRHLRTPTNLVNEALQGDFKGAGSVLFRAVYNTLFGLGGLVDVAKQQGFTYESEDFGQTLATWGVGHGPYIVAPIIGPSSVRDYIGFFVDSFSDPLRWYAFNVDKEPLYLGKVGLEYVNLRSSLIDVLEDLENSSIDYYAATRSAYYQRRKALINDQAADMSVAPEIPDYDDY